MGILLVFLGALGGGGWFAYKKFIVKDKGDAKEVAADPTKPVTPPETPKTPPAKTPETPPPAKAKEPAAPPEKDPLASNPSGEPATPPAVPDKQPETPPVKPEVAANDPKESPMKEPETPPAPVAETPAKETPPPVTETPKEEPVVAAQETPPTPPSPDSPDPLVAPEPVKSFAADAPEVTSLKEDADRRIDEAPSDIYSDADKDKVREAIRQSKRLTRVATLQFGKGAATLGSNERKRLKNALLTPEAEALLSDPQAVFFLIGFADSSGASQANRSLSQKRAAGIGSVLKGFKVTNRAYAVGIGSSNLVGGAKDDKNRAVEVWVVLP